MPKREVQTSIAESGELVHELRQEYFYWLFMAEVIVLEMTYRRSRLVEIIRQEARIGRLPPVIIPRDYETAAAEYAKFRYFPEQERPPQWLNQAQQGGA
ncbi:MAG: hypothetical protein HPY67_03830 [Syntrophaceae bacterium]|nr:hypothetical protein [Syntrophaceae bacterium]